MALATGLVVEIAVDLPSFVANPFAYMARAQMFSVDLMFDQS